MSCSTKQISIPIETSKSIKSSSHQGNVVFKSSHEDIAIAKKIEDHHDELLSCYRKELDDLQRKNLLIYNHVGVANYRFSLNKDGQPQYVTVNLSNEAFSQEMKKCLFEKISDIKFPHNKSKPVFVFHQMKFKLVKKDPLSLNLVK